MTKVSKNKKLAYSISELSKNCSISRGIIYAELKRRSLVGRKCNSRTVVRHADAVSWLKGLPVYGSSNPATQEASHE